MINTPLYSKTGIGITKGFERIVYGDRGAYYEITEDQIIKNRIFIPDNTKWRITHKEAYYIEYRTIVDDIKVYYQLRTVDYADYKVGFYYISIENIFPLKQTTLF